MNCLAIYALAFILRVLPLFFVVSRTGAFEAVAHDACRGGAFWPPLPRLFAESVLYISSGNSFFAACCYAAVAALAAPMVGTLCDELGLPRKVAIFAVILALIYPYHLTAAASQVGISITLTVFVFYAAARWIKRGGQWRDGLLVTVSSLLVLADRANSLTLLAYFSFLVIWYSLRVKKFRLLVYCLMVAGATLIYSSMRYAAYGDFTVLTKNGGYNLLIGNNPHFEEYAWRHDVVFERVMHDYPALFNSPGPEFFASGQGDEALRRKALAEIFADPYLAGKRLLIKAARYFDFRLETADNNSPIKNMAYTAPYLVVLLLALTGITLFFRQRRYVVLALLLGGFFAYAVAPIITIPLIRIRMYTEFVLFIFAAIGLNHFLSRAGRERETDIVWKKRTPKMR